MCVLKCMIQFYSVSKFSVFFFLSLYCFFFRLFLLLLLFQVFTPRYCSVFLSFIRWIRVLQVLKLPAHIKQSQTVFTGFNAIILSSIYYYSKILRTLGRCYCLLLLLPFKRFYFSYAGSFYNVFASARCRNQINSPVYIPSIHKLRWFSHIYQFWLFFFSVIYHT